LARLGVLGFLPDVRHQVVPHVDKKAKRRDHLRVSRAGLGIPGYPIPAGFAVLVELSE
jgi:hypothetical protein